MYTEFIISALLVNLPLAFSPGPANILCLSLASTRGFKGSLKFIAGLQVLPFIYSLIVTLGASEILRHFHHLTLIAKIIGSSYMLYIAYKMLMSNAEIHQEKNVQGGFYHGVLAQALNPKNITIIITIYSLFSHQASQYTYGLMLAFMITLCNLASHLVWSYTADIMLNRKTSFFNRYQDKIFGFLLLIAVIFLWI